MSGNLHFSYPSLSDLVAQANGKSTMKDDERASRDKPITRGRDRDSWSGATWDDALQMAQVGDIEGARRLAPAVLEAVNSIIHNQPRLDPVYRLDEGRWIDVARYVKGEPECWGDMVETTSSPRRGAAVILNVSAAHTISAGQMDAVGVNLGSAILGLQAMGYSVTLYAAEKIENYSGKHLMISAPVNPGGIPLDVSRMSVILRPWFLRRIVFALQETYADKIRETYGIGHSYGRPAYLQAADSLKISGVKNAVVINMQDAVRNPRGVKDNVIRQIKGGK